MGFWPLHEESLVERDAAPRPGIQLHHPALKAVGIKLLIDDAIKRVREIDATAIAADLHHLRSAIECAVLGARMAGAGDDAADPNLAGELRLEGIGNVILQQVAGA